jgi:small subunit ribosomal protein S6
MVCIIHPEVEGDDLAAVIENIEGLVKRGDGRVTHIEPWGMRRLAYQIKKVEDGQYVLLKLELEPQSVAAVDRGLQLMEPVIRHLIVSID